MSTVKMIIVGKMINVVNMINMVKMISLVKMITTGWLTNTISNIRIATNVGRIPFPTVL